METDTAVEQIDDARLLALLRADASRFPDAAVEEIGRRGDRLIPGLLEALGSVDGRPLAAVQAALGAIGRPVLEPLMARARRDVAALDALTAAAVRQPVLQGEILDFFRVLVEDAAAAEDVRGKATQNLLRFARPGDRDLLGDALPPLRSLIREEFWRISVTGHEDDYRHILRPIEESLVDAYRWNRGLTNADARRAVARVLEFLPEAPDEPLARVIHGRLHRAATLSPGRMSNMEIAACLKRVLVQIKTRDGVRAYLDFLDDVLP
ncbi:MAG TPA: hypothetical protein VF950_07820 [Planctomycetota bacterium]